MEVRSRILLYKNVGVEYFGLKQIMTDEGRKVGVRQLSRKTISLLFCLLR